MNQEVSTCRRLNFSKIIKHYSSLYRFWSISMKTNSCVLIFVIVIFLIKKLNFPFMAQLNTWYACAKRIR